MLNNLLYQYKYTDNINYLHHLFVLVKVYSFSKLHWSISETFMTTGVKIAVLIDLTPSKLVEKYNIYVKPTASVFRLACLQKKMKASISFGMLFSFSQSKQRQLREHNLGSIN
jgi:hypothetical protein